MQRRLTQDFALKRDKWLDHVQFVVPIVFRGDYSGVDVHNADIPFYSFVIRFLQRARRYHPVFLQGLFVLDIQQLHALAIMVIKFMHFLFFYFKNKLMME